VDGSLGRVFSSRTSVSLDRRFVVFGVRDLEPELRHLGVYLIADYLWREVRRRRLPRVLLIDEAWQLVQHAEGARFLAAMARQARKHYLGLTTVTQDVADFLATPEGHTVLANASAQLLLRQDASTIDAVGQTFRLSAGDRTAAYRDSRWTPVPTTRCMWCLPTGRLCSERSGRLTGTGMAT
jgi:conjugal transfer ATP-binding protein TraC